MFSKLHTLSILFIFTMAPILGQDGDSTEAEDEGGREIITRVDLSFSQEKGNTEYLSKYYSFYFSHIGDAGPLQDTEFSFSFSRSDDRLDGESFMDDQSLILKFDLWANQKLSPFLFFEKSFILGVTATPLSSNVKLPMKDNYNELIVGETIESLIENEFLSRAKTYSYNVGLTSLVVGSNGDYTVKSSEDLYTNMQMLGKLLQAYEERSKGKKTLIFKDFIYY